MRSMQGTAMALIRRMPDAVFIEALDDSDACGRLLQ